MREKGKDRLLLDYEIINSRQVVYKDNPFVSAFITRSSVEGHRSRAGGGDMRTRE